MPIYANQSSSRLVLSGVREFPADERDVALNPGEKLDSESLQLQDAQFEKFRSVARAVENKWLIRLESMDDEVTILPRELPARNEYDIKLEELENKDAAELERLRAQNKMRGRGNIVVPSSDFYTPENVTA